MNFQLFKRVHQLQVTYNSSWGAFDILPTNRGGKILWDVAMVEKWLKITMNSTSLSRARKEIKFLYALWTSSSKIFPCPEPNLRVRSFGVIWIRISDPSSVRIMVNQRNRWIHDYSGFIGSTDTLIHHDPHRSTQMTDPNPDHPKRTHSKPTPSLHFSIMFADDLYDLLPIGQVRVKILLAWPLVQGNRTALCSSPDFYTLYKMTG